MGVVKTYKRGRNLFNPDSKTPFRLSRSRLENFISCPRCFYLDRRLGISQPSMPAFTLNSAVDQLLKTEFDSYRAKKETHPLMKKYGIDAVPFAHPMIDEWREAFKGISTHHKKTNLIIFGAIDDIWVNPRGEFYIVDYKATSTAGPITLETEYRQAYKRQMEIYQWLFRRQDFNVSDTGYFVYCNGDKSKAVFDGKLEFDVEIIAYQGSDDWVESVICDAHRCLMSDSIPEASEECEYCRYRMAASEIENVKQPKQDIQGELFSI